MLGYVFVFRPMTGAGTIVAESGRAYPFESGGAHANLQGGDLVHFQVDFGAPSTQLTAAPVVSRIELVQKGSEQLAVGHRSLVKELYRTVQMETPVAHC